MLTLVDRVKRLAFDPRLTDADIARRLRDLLTEHAEGGTPMNVLELTALLEDADPDAEVLIVSQPSWLLRFTSPVSTTPATTPSRATRTTPTSAPRATRRQRT